MLFIYITVSLAHIVMVTSFPMQTNIISTGVIYNEVNQVLNEVLDEEPIIDYVRYSSRADQRDVKYLLPDINRDVKYDSQNLVQDSIARYDDSVSSPRSQIHRSNMRLGKPSFARDVKYQVKKVEDDEVKIRNTYLTSIYKMLVNMRKEDEKLQDLCTKLSASRNGKLSSFIKRIFVCGENDLNRRNEEMSNKMETHEIESLALIVSDLSPLR